ncbi:MAG: hypothetical protein ACLGHG_03760 [Gammaproteobacteria bacterium]
MARPLSLILASVLALMLGACASQPQDPVSQNPNFDGIYRLAFSGTGSALYYRFYNDGSVLSARSDAPVFDIVDMLKADNADVSRGTWSARAGELRIGVDEGTVSYDSRFDLRGDGRIALRGLPRSFEFIRFDGGKAVVSTR